MYETHEVRCALGTHHHRSEEAHVQIHELGEGFLVLGRREIGEPCASTRRDEEIRVKRNRPLCLRPLHQRSELPPIPSGADSLW
jgi:hypothetical protein